LTTQVATSIFLSAGSVWKLALKNQFVVRERAKGVRRFGQRAAVHLPFSEALSEP
jgi:hypothetical protein